LVIQQEDEQVAAGQPPGTSLGKSESSVGGASAGALAKKKAMDDNYQSELGDSKLSSTSSLGKVADWWRWPLVPLGSIAGAIGGAILMTLLQWLALMIEGRGSADGWWYRFVQPIIVFGVLGYLWSTLAYSIAPRGKLISAVVMITLLGVLWAVFLFNIMNDQEFPIGTKIHSSIGVVASMIAAIGGGISKESEV
jgi:hypothetical protein